MSPCGIAVFFRNAVHKRMVFLSESSAAAYAGYDTKNLGKTYFVKLKRRAIAVRPSTIHGYGVFAERRIPKGAVIEECPVLLQAYKHFELVDYYFAWQKQQALPLGYGLVYNHSARPNAATTIDTKRNLLIITADRNIRAGEEIMIDYGGAWFSNHRLDIRTPRYHLRSRHWQRLFEWIVLVVVFVACFSIIYLGGK